MRQFWILMLLLPALAGCDRPNIEACEKLCRHYGKLRYDESVRASTQIMSPGEAAAAEKAAAEKWQGQQTDKAFLLGLDNCVTDCRQRTGKKDIRCVLNSKTSAEADVCLK